MTTHIIARRLLEPRRTEESGWRMLPGALMSLADARAAYDQGTIEMAQSHPGDGFVYQTVQVRKRRAPGPYPRYFALRDDGMPGRAA